MKIEPSFEAPIGGMDQLQEIERGARIVASSKSFSAYRFFGEWRHGSGFSAIGASYVNGVAKAARLPAPSKYSFFLKSTTKQFGQTQGLWCKFM